MVDILPSSVARELRGVIVRDGVSYVPVFCANCGAKGPLVIDADQRFAFYQCEPCAEKFGEIVGMMKIPDEVHWEIQHQEQLARYGRPLDVVELAEIEKDGNHTLVKLARDFK
jgi:hypothetical protein